MPADALADRLARYVCGLRFSDLSRDHVERMKLFFLDWLGSAYAGGDAPPVRMMRDVVLSLGGTAEATVIADGSRSNAMLAAFVNGASSHVVEMDDLHREAVIHPACVVVPAVLAAAERQHASGRELVTAMSAGYEVAIRVALAVGPSHYRFWHTTGTCGVFGAAAGAARMLGLDENRIAWALGSAGTQAAGLWEFLVESAMSKQLHPGKAALNGVLAALLAKEDFTGARRILEGEKGFFRATSRDFDEQKCCDNLGKVFHADRNAIKYHASCGHTHSMIDAIDLAAGGETFMPDEVEEVRISLYQAAIALLGGVEPKTPYLAKFCIPFCAATAIRYGHVQLEDFTEARLRDADLRALMGRIRIQSDPELTRAYARKWPARVRMVLQDGRRLDGANEYPKGDPENPLSEAEVIGKFRSLVAGVIPLSRVGTLVDRILSIEDCHDIGMLLSGMEAAGPGPGGGRPQTGCQGREVDRHRVGVADGDGMAGRIV